ncbi:MAG: tetratricopeptide repeat protein [Chthoniobacterales bacterium]
MKTCFNLARCLKVENKIAEASDFVRRAVEGARKILGADHPFTKKCEQLLHELLGKEG